ncbi:MAG: hypothetical protein M3457_09870, partial [Chloroflexota bacterium]|nr:hypothetical protein [Chloroflexota bacterium]
MVGIVIILHAHGNWRRRSVRARSVVHYYTKDSGGLAKAQRMAAAGSALNREIGPLIAQALSYT